MNQIALTLESLKYSILEKPEFELALPELVRISLRLKLRALLFLIFHVTDVLESVPTKVEYSVNEIVDFSDNAAEEEAKEEKKAILVDTNSTWTN